jgi:hypothetical protein
LLDQEPKEASETLWEERVESLKTGAVGAIAAALMFGIVTVINSGLLLPKFGPLVGIPLWNQGAYLWVGGAIAQFSGFLFAITYRYIIRQDQNPHLKSGAVAAFGFVRGFAELEGRLTVQAHPLMFVMIVLESMVLFAGVQIVLDWAIAQGKLKPFGFR